MTTQLSAVIITCVAGLSGTVMSVFISKAVREKPTESPYLRELTDILKRMEMWEKESRDDLKEVKADTIHIREKVDSDHNNIKDLGLHHRDQDNGINLISESMKAFHRRLDGLKINP